MFTEHLGCGGLNPECYTLLKSVYDFIKFVEQEHDKEVRSKNLETESLCKTIAGLKEENNRLRLHNLNTED